MHVGLFLSCMARDGSESCCDRPGLSVALTTYFVPVSRSSISATVAMLRRQCKHAGPSSISRRALLLVMARLYLDAHITCELHEALVGNRGKNRTLTPE